MTQEEKARAYDEALERARKWLTPEFSHDMLYDILPELCESEDERIRKALIDGVRQIRCKNGITQEQMLTWLEKQKEQKPDDDPLDDPKFLKGFDTGREVQRIFDEPKPAEWSEEDEDAINGAIGILLDDNNPTFVFPEHSKLSVGEIVKRLRSLRPQPKQEWSKEDGQWLESIIKDYEDSLTKDKDHAAVIKIKIDFLKSLRPQPHWKPSEEQMEALKCAVLDIARFSKRGGRQVEFENEPYYSALHSLYCNLEKLM